VTLEFSGPLFQWRGPAPFYFVRVPLEECEVLREASKLLTYGWGMIPVHALVGETEWKTSLWPKNGGYIVPVKANVRRSEGLAEGDEVRVSLEVG